MIDFTDSNPYLVFEAALTDWAEMPLTLAKMKIGDRTGSILHQRMMKPAGFRKTGRTFSKEHDGYSEHYNIQGSAWNDQGRPWTFYLNCAISFPDIPIHSPGTGLWKFHAHTRIARLVPEARSEYKVADADVETVVDEVGHHIQKCSEYFANRWKVLRNSYSERDYAGGFPRDSEEYNGQQVAAPNP